MIHGKVAKNLPLFAHLELKVQTNFTAAGEAKLLGHFQPGGCDAAHAAGRAVGRAKKAAVLGGAERDQLRLPVPGPEL